MKLSPLRTDSVCDGEHAEGVLLLRCGDIQVPPPPSHLAVGPQLHSLQPDHHLLGADASGRVPLTPSFQLHIPDEHKNFRALTVRTICAASHSCPSAGRHSGSLPRPWTQESGPYLICTQRRLCLELERIRNEDQHSWDFLPWKILIIYHGNMIHVCI